MITSTRPQISAVHPLWAVEGGRIRIAGEHFPVDPPPGVLVGGVQARITRASTQSLDVIVPAGLEGGRTAVRLESVAGETAYVEIGAPLATGLHQVDSPVFDAEGNLYVTFSGARGQQSPVSIYVVRRNGSREPFVSNLPNPTSMAVDADGVLYVSSRFDGSVHRVDPDGTVSVFATDLGVACGIAFGPDGALYVGDRSGSVLRLEHGRARLFATLPGSVAAFHLAFAPDGALFVTAPTLSTRDGIYRITSSGEATVFYESFGRPQGLAFDADGALYVVEALAGASGVFRFRAGEQMPEQVVTGGAMIGIAFDPDGGLVLASGETVYRIDVPLTGLLPPRA